jgi:hypothetical protein
MPGLDFYTKICLHGDGTDTSTSFPDSSFRARLFTVTNHAQVDTDQKVLGTGSILFDGDDYISTPGSDDFRFGTDNFTVDFWVRWNGTPGASDFMGIGYTGPWNNKWLIGWNTAATGLCLHFWDGSGAHTLSWAWSPSASTWYHVALVRSGNTFTAYIDGTSIGTPGTDTGSLSPDNANGLCIGTDGEQWQYFNGWLDEVRISKGIARWTSDFTPPEEAYSSDTALVYGIDSYTKLMLHCNGEDAGTYFPDSSASNHTVIVHSDAQVDTAQSRFGGASAVFDGDDYLEVADSADWQLHGLDWTIDCWVRLLNGIGNICCRSHGTGSYEGFYFDLNSGYIRFITDDNSTQITGVHGIPLNAWTHVAAVRYGSTITLYVDGVSKASATADVQEYSASLHIGFLGDYTEYLQGWIDEFRISKGIARWTTAFTPYNDEYIATLPPFHQTTNTAMIVLPTSVQK